jgi:diguanylate cyclase (GGDEF)-like protein
MTEAVRRGDDPEPQAPAGRGLTAGREAALLGCVQELARAARETSYVAMDRRQLEHYLQDVLARLVRALVAEPFTTDPGYQVGAELIGAHFTGPEMSGRVVKILGSRLLPDLDLDTPAHRTRLAALLGAVSTSFARALRDRTLDDQEDIRRAAFLAQHSAERALRDSEERRWAEARRDPLTGLPNRLGLTEHLSGVLTAAAPGDRLGLALINLDRFQAVNDTLGPDAADRLLIAVADRLRSHLPAGTRPGTVLARIGGDEFALLLPGTDSHDDLVKAVDVLLGRLAEHPIAAGATPLSLTASAGLIERPATRIDTDELLRAADIALSWAKADGRSWSLFDADRSATDTARWALAAEFPGALEGGQLVVHYQPIVRLADGRPHAVEALVRWAHPRRGLLLPGQFIPSAEETGLVVPLGRHVLATACAEAATWTELTPKPPLLSVNLAARQARDPRLVADVLAILDQTDLPPDRLQLEVTETTVLSPDDDALTTLRALAEHRIRIAVDDFGTGHANHTWLRRLPLHELKLAADFVTRVGGPDADLLDQHVTASLINLGHTLGLTVTAEGVETAHQAGWLRAAGCDTAQGWHYARAVPSGQLRRLLGGGRLTP